MRNLLLLSLLLLLFQVSALAQEDILQTTIEVKAGNYKHKELLQHLGQQYELAFSYNDDILFPDRLPLQHSFSGSLADFLQEYMVSLGYQYKVVGQQIVLFATEEASLWVTVSGFIKEEQTNELLIGATVYIDSLHIGAVTNAYGFYALKVPRGQHELSIKCLGFAQRKLPLFVWGNASNSYWLKPESYAVEEVRIMGRAGDPFLESDILYTSKLDIQTLQKLPAMFGEKDAIRNISMLPGIQSNELSTGSVFVRGGSNDQTIFLMDEANLYNASHFGGFFSVFNPDVVNSVSVYRSDIPVSEGGALSSLIDVRLRDGNQDAWKLKGSVGLISARASLEGPLIKNKTTILMAFRQSYLDKIYPYFLSDSLTRKIRFSFYDANLKINHIINTKNRIYFSGYTSYDYFRQFSEIWRNTILGSFRWNHLYGQRLFSNLSVIYSDNVNSQTLTISQSDLVWRSDNKNARIKLDYSFLQSKHARSEFGLSSLFYHILPNSVYNEGGSELATLDVSQKDQLFIHSAYFVQHLLPARNFSINAGLRSSWILSNPFSETKEDYRQWFVEPHLHLSYKLPQGWLLKSSFSRPVQPIHQLPLSTMGISINRWMPANSTFKPQVSSNYSFGVVKNVQENMHFSVETYYRKMDHLIETLQDMRILTVDNPEAYLHPAEGEAYGVEFFFSYQNENLSLFTTLDLSNARWLTEGVNANQPYPASHIRKHSLDLSASYRFSERWSCSAAWKLASGLPYTAATGKYEVDGKVYLRFDEDKINTQITPTYHRLDLSIDYVAKHNTRTPWKSYWNLSVQNVYLRKNALGLYYYSPTTDANGNLVDASISPSYFYLYRFVPSLSYRFEF